MGAVSWGTSAATVDQFLGFDLALEWAGFSLPLSMTYRYSVPAVIPPQYRGQSHACKCMAEPALGDCCMRPTPSYSCS